MVIIINNQEFKLNELLSAEERQIFRIFEYSSLEEFCADFDINIEERAEKLLLLNLKKQVR